MYKSLTLLNDKGNNNMEKNAYFRLKVSVNKFSIGMQVLITEISYC